MKFDPEKIQPAGVILVVTDVVSAKNVHNPKGDQKDYQKFGFRFEKEFLQLIKSYRVHFYHFDKDSMESFVLRDKIFQRIIKSVSDLYPNEKVLIVVDKEDYDCSIHLTGEKFESSFLSCVPENNSPIVLDMSKHKKDISIQQLSFFLSDGIDKQGGFIKEFTEVELGWIISDN